MFRADPPLRPGETKAKRRASGLAPLYSFQWRDLPGGHWRTSRPACYTSTRIARFRKQLETAPDHYDNREPLHNWQRLILSTNPRGRPNTTPAATPRDAPAIAAALDIPATLAAYLSTPSTP